MYICQMYNVAVHSCTEVRIQSYSLTLPLKKVELKLMTPIQYIVVQCITYSSKTYLIAAYLGE